jgi:hypothetical protein
VSPEVSTIDSRWAALGLRSFDKSGAPLQPVEVVLHRRAPNDWVVRNYGTEKVGCVMPAKVRVDLKISC